MAICDSVESCGELVEQLLSGDMTAILGLGLLLLILGLPILWRFWSRRAKPEPEKPKSPENPGGGNQINIGAMSGGKVVGSDDHSVNIHGPQNGVINTGDNVEIHNHQGLGGDEVDQIVQTLLQHHQNERQADQETIKSLTAAVEALSLAAAQPDATPSLQSAQAQLAQGDVTGAEAVFTQILKAKRASAQQKLADGTAELKEAAEAARHLGALAFLHDTQAALTHYRTATDLDPDDPEGWNQLGHLLDRIGELDRAIEAYDRVLSIGEARQDRECISAATGNLGTIYLTRGDLGQAEGMLKRGLDLDEELDRKEGVAAKLGNLGLIYRTRGDLDQAEDMHKRALALEEELGRKEGMASDLGNLGIIYKTRGDLNQAEEMYKRALAIHEELGRKEGMANQLGNLGIIYNIRGDLDHAEDMHKRAIAIEEELGRKEGMANNLGNLGAVYQTLGGLDQAESMYKRALAIDEELGRKRGMASHLGNLGVLREQQGDMAAACDFWRQALALFTEIGAKPQMEQVQALLAEVGEEP